MTSNTPTKAQTPSPHPTTATPNAPAPTTATTQQQVRVGLPLKIGGIVLAVEAIVLLLLSNYFIQRFRAEMDRRVEEAIAKPGRLLSQGALSTDAFGRRETLEGLVGAPLDDAMILSADGLVLVALDPDRIGKNWETIVPAGRVWLSQASQGGITERVTSGEDSFLVRVAPILIAPGQTPALFNYVRVQTTENHRELVALRATIIGGSAAAFLATTLALMIAGHFLVTRRLQKIAGAVEQVAAGNYRIHMTSEAHADEITFLSTGFNSMAERLDQTFHRLRTAIHDAEAAEAKYRVLFDNASEAIFVVQSGRFAFANPACHRIMGIPSEKLFESSILDFVHPEDRSLVEERHARRMQGEDPPDTYEFRIVTATGRQLQAELKVVRIEWNGAPATLNFLNDITARHQAEERFRRESAFRQAILDGAGDGLCVCHEIPEEPHVHFTIWNPRMTEITGYTMEEINRLGWYQSVYPDPELRARAQERMSRMRVGDNLHNEEWEITRADGARRTLAISTSIVESDTGHVHVLGLMRDVSEHRKANDAVRLSQAQLLASLENTPNIAIQWFDEQGRVLYWNPASEALYGWKSADALGKTLDQLIHTPEEAVAFARVLRAIKETGRPVGPYESAVRRGNGQPGVVLATTFAIPLGNDRTGFVCMDIDITDRKRAEAENKQLQEQLLHAQKLESVGRLAGGVAHDFNNMLQAILGNVYLALADTPADHPSHDHLVEIRNSARRSADLTRQLLAFARKQPIAPKIVALNDVVTGLLAMLRRLLGEQIELEFRASPGLWPIQIDPSQVDQILANLCVNARDAITGHGRIIIETHNLHLDPASAAQSPDARPGDYVRLIVTDNGSGMDPETLSHVFEPFFTTKDVGQGTGLGLAMVFGIVKQNQGLIEVESEPGRGTSFRILLPRCEPTPEPAAAAAPAEPAPARGRETVLLVEDEPQVLNLSRRILTRNGYQVLCAATPAAAIELAARHGSEIDLLITDVIMPGMNGRALRDRLQEDYPGLKTLFISGYTADIVGRQGVQEENIDFLQKPFTVDDLTSKVRAMIDRSPARDSLQP